MVEVVAQVMMVARVVAVALVMAEGVGVQLKVVGACLRGRTQVAKAAHYPNKAKRPEKQRVVLGVNSVKQVVGGFALSQHLFDHFGMYTFLPGLDLNMDHPIIGSLPHQPAPPIMMC